MRTVTIEPEERSQLEALARSTQDAKTVIRIRAILALDAGYRIKDVANILGLDEDTVTKWRNKYLQRRLFTDWLATKSVGYDGKLTREQKLELEHYVVNETITDAAIVVDYIRQHYVKDYTINGVTKL